MAKLGQDHTKWSMIHTGFTCCIFIMLFVIYTHQLVRIRTIDVRTEAAKRYCLTMSQLINDTCDKNGINESVAKAVQSGSRCAMDGCNGGAEVFNRHSLLPATDYIVFNDEIVDSMRQSEEDRMRDINVGQNVPLPGQRLRRRLSAGLQHSDTVSLSHTRWSGCDRVEQIVCAAAAADDDYVVAISFDIIQ